MHTIKVYITQILDSVQCSATQTSPKLHCNYLETLFILNQFQPLSIRAEPFIFFFLPSQQNHSPFSSFELERHNSYFHKIPCKKAKQDLNLAPRSDEANFRILVLRKICLLSGPTPSFADLWPCSLVQCFSGCFRKFPEAYHSEIRNFRGSELLPMSKMITS